jgi:hypothetical protein
MASATSITAFPIMARILKERSMTHSVIGRLSLTSAALADVLAWTRRRPASRRCHPQCARERSHARGVVEAVDDAAHVIAMACWWLRPLDDVAYAGSRAGFVRC